MSGECWKLLELNIWVARKLSLLKCSSGIKYKLQCHNTVEAFAFDIVVALLRYLSKLLSADVL